MSLRITNTNEHDNFLAILGYEALDSLNALSQLIKKQCDITFTNNISELPKDFIKLLALKINSCHNNDTNDPINNQLFNNCGLALYIDTKFLNLCGCDVGSWGLNNLTPYNQGFQINGRFLHFNFSSELTEIQTATLAYFGLNIDKDGNSLLYRRYERAIAAYMCYKFTMAWSEMFNQYLINEYKQEWVNQKSKLVGQDVAQDNQQNKFEINKFFNALLVSRSVNIT